MLSSELKIGYLYAARVPMPNPWTGKKVSWVKKIVRLESVTSISIIFRGRFLNGNFHTKSHSCPTDKFLETAVEIGTATPNDIVQKIKKTKKKNISKLNTVKLPAKKQLTRFQLIMQDIQGD
jgi:hypothetical protein